MKIRRTIVGLVLTAVSLAGVTAATATPVYDPIADASLNKTVLFVGDSNYVFGAAKLTEAMVNRANGYLPEFAPRGGIGIRGYKQGYCTTACVNPDYWQTRLASVLAVVHPDAVVVDLGINDTALPGSLTTAGYSSYAAKMQWLLDRLPDGVPVFWSGLPTPIEPTDRVTGCNAVNAAITAANAAGTIHVLRWYTLAYQHPEYMRDVYDDVHLSDAGNEAYAAMVTTALDTYFVTSPTARHK